ncbi:hypothetical protein BDW74DRAFT_137037 [Aspergillus multicolor]|uniref:uncharacterized protein n=1 Tax=Aspergillus multicolor TaxID=41759 RepID=UPI003CCD9873
MLGGTLILHFCCPNPPVLVYPLVFELLVLISSRSTSNAQCTLRVLGYLFSGAFSSRARCIPPEGFHFEVIHIEQGESFNPIMSWVAQNTTKKKVLVPEPGTRPRCRCQLSSVCMALSWHLGPT